MAHRCSVWLSWISVSMFTFPITSFSGGNYSANSSKFDGTNDYMLRGGDLTGVNNGKKGIFSCWLNLNGGDASLLRIYTAEATTPDGSNFFTVFRNSSNLFVINATNVSGETNLLSIRTSVTYVSTAKHLHILASWNMASAGSGSIYMNDILDYNEVAFIDGALDYTPGNNAVGSRPNGTQKFNGCLAELYLNLGESLDFSVASNRRKFIDGEKFPVSLGSDGSTPTGTVPDVYLKNAFSSFGTNSAGGGNFTVTGSLEACASKPSD